MKIFGIQINFFRSKEDKLKEELEKKIEAHDFTGAAEIINSNRKIDFSPSVKKFSQVFNEAIIAEEIPTNDELKVFMTFVRADVTMTPQIFAFGVENATSQFHAIEPYHHAKNQALEARKGQKAQEAPDLKPYANVTLRNVTMMEFACTPGEQRKMDTKINLVRFLSEIGIPLSDVAFANILQQTQTDLKGTNQYGKVDPAKKGWPLHEVVEVFKNLLQPTTELAKLIEDHKKTILEKFGQKGLDDLKEAANQPRKEKISSSANKEQPDPTKSYPVQGATAANFGGPSQTDSINSIMY